MGRPSDYSEEIGKRICERLADGEALSRICRDEDFPAKSTVYKWMELHPEFSNQYARAKEQCADMFFDQIGEIAHDGSKDWVMTKTGPIMDSEHVQRSRLRVDALKWQASKLAPKKYGDRTTLVGDDEQPIAIKRVVSDL